MCVFIYVVTFIVACVHTHAIQVNTTEGVVEGYKAKDGDYYQFYGIPYAGPTDGYNRFKAPIPPTPYKHILHANDSSILCAQPSTTGHIGVENCLVLNIFTNNVTSPKPVVVWLNAEDYAYTSISKYSFKTFVEENITFVSLNFRLSIYGFLCLGVEEAPGNAGLRDVIQGLKWIHANIANFGGDPKNLTLMGHASGAAMVDILTLAPQANGLFQKAIALSGSSLAPWAIAYDPIGYAEVVGSKIGKTNNIEDLALLFTTTNSTELNTVIAQFGTFRNNSLLFAPCIESRNQTLNATVLSDAPLNLIRKGNFSQIPYITGYTTLEGTMRLKEAVSGDWIKGINYDFPDFLPVDLSIDANKTYLTNKIGKYYFDQKPRLSMDNIYDYLQFEGDVLVIMPVIREAIERSKTSKADVRLLVFGYIGTNNSDWTYKDIPLYGVKHGGLLNYLFDFDLKPADKYIMKSIVHHFVTFIKTGTQNADIPYDEWFPITLDHVHSLNYAPYGKDTFNSFMRETWNRLHFETKEFWDDLFKQFYSLPKSVNSSTKSVIAKKITIFICIISSAVHFLISH